MFRGLPDLRKLDLINTRITPDGVERLIRDRPGLAIKYQPGEGYVEPAAPAPLDVAPPETP